MRRWRALVFQLGDNSRSKLRPDPICANKNRFILQGDSLLPLLRGEQPVGWRQSFYYHYYESLVTHRVPEHYGVVTERYKLVRYPITDEWELFDRQQDPTELDSRYGDPAYSEIQAQLASELERLRDDLQAEVDR